MTAEPTDAMLLEAAFRDALRDGDVELARILCEQLDGNEAIEVEVMPRAR